MLEVEGTFLNPHPMICINVIDFCWLFRPTTIINSFKDLYFINILGVSPRFSLSSGCVTSIHHPSITALELLAHPTFNVRTIQSKTPLPLLIQHLCKYFYSNLHTKNVTCNLLNSPNTTPRLKPTLNSTSPRLKQDTISSSVIVGRTGCVTILLQRQLLTVLGHFKTRTHSTSLSSIPVFSHLAGIL